MANGIKKLGFFKKLFTGCVSYDDALALLNRMNASNSTVDALRTTIDSYEEIVSKQKEEIVDLVRIKSAIEKDSESKIKLIAKLQDDLKIVTSYLTAEKDKNDTTLAILKDANDEINDLKEQIVILEDSIECEPPLEEEVIEEIIVGTPSEEVIEVTPPPVKTNDKKLKVLAAYINTLTEEDLNQLCSDLLTIHSNDKRLSTTLNNYVSRYSDVRQRAMYILKTSLVRRKGASSELGIWYTNYNAFVKTK